MNHIARVERAMQTWNHLARNEQIIQTCVDACDLCHRVCLQNALNYFTEIGFEPVNSDTLRHMVNCAEICQMLVNSQISDAGFYLRLCEACEICATECEKIGGMIECVIVCRDCAESCRQMATIQY
jgi:hypothetical protein